MDIEELAPRYQLAQKIYAELIANFICNGYEPDSGQLRHMAAQAINAETFFWLEAEAYESEPYEDAEEECEEPDEEFYDEVRKEFDIATLAGDDDIPY